MVKNIVNYRCRYRLVGTSTVNGRKRYIWQATVRGDSRVEQVQCDAQWFWGPR